MQQRILSVIAAAGLSVCCAFGLAACGSGNGGDGTNGQQHTHSYSEEWSYDETYHWHAADCGHADIVADKEEHSFLNGVCSECGYSKVSLGLAYRLNDDGQSYSVTGRGDCRKLNITIPSMYNDLPVTAVGRYAFEDTPILSVTLPDGMVSIEGGAFMNCDSLTDIHIPGSVKNIEASAFKGCLALTAISLPDVSAIHNFTFAECKALQEIIIPDSVTEIGSSAFKSCTSIKSIAIPERVTYIRNDTFYNCSSLTSIMLPADITNIDSWAFKNCSSLMEIRYNGTRGQWNNIKKESWWDIDTPNYTIYCTDGNIAK